ncbi:MerR family transcriptional regulator [Novosphingobium sp.]|uniref:MerR family transcriptional regulator n=1 Tax=Novosphingobium sp. TaxID=1874826 RepID=UPI00260704F4|nr:MerR family transcriptional regulator [Novosphingobium sp.]
MLPAVDTPGSTPLATPAFDDGKEPDALRTIGEVAKALGLKQHVLRYWEEQFPMLKPLTRAGGRRYYRPEDIALVARIDQLLHREGYTIRGARLALSGKSPAKPAAPLQAEPGPLAETPARASEMPAEEEIISAIRILRRHLETIRHRLVAALED